MSREENLEIYSLKSFVSIIEEELFPVARQVIRKFGNKKQKRKLTEEHGEVIASRNEANDKQYYFELIDFMFVCLQFLHQCTDFNEDLMLFTEYSPERNYLDHVEIDNALYNLLQEVNKKNKLNSTSNENLMLLTYGIFQYSFKHSKDSWLNFNEKNEFLSHIDKIIYHCTRLVKYEFKE